MHDNLTLHSLGCLRVLISCTQTGENTTLEQLVNSAINSNIQTIITSSHQIVKLPARAFSANHFRTTLFVKQVTTFK